MQRHARTFNRQREVRDENWCFRSDWQQRLADFHPWRKRKPTFELNKANCAKGEHYHFDFALSMIKLRGFGGKTEFWDHNLESFTLMAGLAAVTSRIQIRAAATTCAAARHRGRRINHHRLHSSGRFGVNLVTEKPEYDQMGIWPGDEYFSPPFMTT
jgi:pyrimidine oxygenase